MGDKWWVYIKDGTPKSDMPSGKRLRRHSLAGYYNDANARDFVGEPMIARKQSQENNLRVVSPKPEGEVDTRLEAASAKIAEQEAENAKLRAEVQAATLKLEARTNQAASNVGDLGQIPVVERELSQIRHQLSRANAPDSLSGGSRGATAGHGLVLEETSTDPRGFGTDLAPNQLENNIILGVIQLTQTLQQRDNERKAAEQQVRDVEQQLTIWQSKYEESAALAQKLRTEIQTLQVSISKLEAGLKYSAEVETRLEAASAKVAEQEAQITKLSAEVQAATVKLETRANEAASTAGDLGQIQALKQELSQMRDQLNRANALNSLSGGSRRTAEPVSLTFQTGLKEYASHQQNGAPGLGVSAATAGKRHHRRHSSAGHYNDASIRDSVDERMIAGKRSQANNPRAVSVAYNGLDGLPRYRNGLEEIYDDPGEERIRLLSDLDRLDAEVYEGLILGLKIPSPTSANAPSLKEVLFPANLISLISNEMWRYGMIKESERFLANTMQTVQAHVMSFTGEDAIVPGVFWLSNVHEILSFVCSAEADMMQGIGPTSESASYDWPAYQHLIQMVKSDLDSLEYNIYHSWMVETKKRLSKMIIPALIETQSLPGFIISEGAGRLFNRLLNQNTAPAYNMDDVLNLLNKVLKSLKCFFMEESVIKQVVAELLKLVGVTSFNDLLMRRNFCSWKRAMQIQYNITRIEEWCKLHEMPEGTLQLEHLKQATQLLQLKKATQADIDIIYDKCWILTPSQIQRMFANYFVADYENPISPEILKLVARRVQPNDRTDRLLLTPENQDVAPYELPLPREVAGLERYVPAYLNIPHIRRLAAITP
ncbi:Myosin type-2 heavy chain 1 [Ceratobasidium sp. 423]|nr:Myosin type-2 heavy chain 1 [Ceratobasidium sp. 423]